MITFLALLCVVYSCTMIELLFFRGRAHHWDTYNYNLIPFKTISNYIVSFEHFNYDTSFKNLFGNIVLFIPIGVFGPLLNGRLSAKMPFILVSLSILVAIETIQLVTKVGSFDIDDLILNCLGAMIGFGLTALLKRFINRIGVSRLRRAKAFE